MTVAIWYLAFASFYGLGWLFENKILCYNCKDTGITESCVSSLFFSIFISNLAAQYKISSVWIDSVPTLWCEIAVCNFAPRNFAVWSWTLIKMNVFILPNGKKPNGLVCKALDHESEVIALSLACCVTLGKPINFSVPQVLHLYNEDHDSYLKRNMEGLMRQHRQNTLSSMEERYSIITGHYHWI